MERNVLHITIDSLRTDVCGFLGDVDCTPFLSSIADDATVLENAIAPGPRTPSSMPGVFTGEFGRHEEYDMRDQRNAIGLHLSTHDTIPARLSEHGYHTIGFTANPWTAADTRFDRGFDEFYELNPNADQDIPSILYTPLAKSIDKTLYGVGRPDLLGWETRREWFTHWTAFYEQVLQRLNELEEPYYAWIFIMDTHHPLVLPPAFRTETNWLKMYYTLLRYRQGRDETIPGYVVDWMRQSYRDAARSADEFVKRLWTECNDPDTALVVHSDHGESHGDHETYGHEFRLYEENVRVPLLIDGIGSDRIDEPFSLIQLPRVIEELATDPDPGVSDYTDQLVVSGAESTTIARRRGNKLNYSPHYVALRGADFKYITTDDGEELYDLSDDPHEEEDIADRNPDATEVLNELASVKTAKQREKWNIVEAIRQIEL
jgi:arylsulfatase